MVVLRMNDTLNVLPQYCNPNSDLTKHNVSDIDGSRLSISCYDLTRVTIPAMAGSGFVAVIETNAMLQATYDRNQIESRYVLHY